MKVKVKRIGSEMFIAPDVFRNSERLRPTHREKMQAQGSPNYIIVRETMRRLSWVTQVKQENSPSM